MKTWTFLQMNPHCYLFKMGIILLFSVIIFNTLYCSDSGTMMASEITGVINFSLKIGIGNKFILTSWFFEFTGVLRYCGNNEFDPRQWSCDLSLLTKYDLADNCGYLCKFVIHCFFPLHSFNKLKTKIILNLFYLHE